MASPNAPVQIPSERTRKLQALTFAENSILSRDLPRDTVLRYLTLRLSGAVTTTFGSGTPVADAMAVFDNLVPRIDIIINGNRTVKNVRPHLMSMQQLLFRGIRGERRSSAGAAAVINPTVDAGFTYGTTGQITTVAETILISLENMCCDVGMESTWLNLKGVASAELRLTTGAFHALLGFGNTAPVVYSASTMKVDITTLEAQDVPSDVFFADFKQSTKEVTYSAQVSESLVEINRGSMLQGLMFYTRDGAAGSATTASGKLASNNVLDAIKLQVNGGDRVIKATTFWELQAENRSKYGVQAPYASNVSALDGIAYLDLLKRGRLDSALPTQPPAVDQIHAVLSTRAAADVSYTNPVSVTIMTNEIVKPQSA